MRFGPQGNQPVLRRDFLKLSSFLSLGLAVPALVNGAEEPKLVGTPAEKATVPTEGRPYHWMHTANPTLTSSLPAIAAEFYEAGVLIDKNFDEQKKDDPLDTLRYNNADAWSRPWAGLVVNLGALLARYASSSGASLLTDSLKLQSRFASMFSYYSIVGEVRYLRNPILGVLRDVVKNELEAHPELYKDDPRNIPWTTILVNLCRKRKNLDQKDNANHQVSERETNTQRFILDLLIFSMSLLLGLGLDSGSGRAAGGIFGSGFIVRDLMRKEEAKAVSADDLQELRHRSRAELITWPAVFAFNAILQNLVATFMPVIFKDDELANDHLKEMIGNFGQAAIYCVGKTRAQAHLESASKQGKYQDLWEIVDWYIKP